MKKKGNKPVPVSAGTQYFFYRVRAYSNSRLGNSRYYSRAPRGRDAGADEANATTPADSTPSP